MSMHTLCFEQKYEKNQVFIWKFSFFFFFFFCGIFYIFAYACFRDRKISLIFIWRLSLQSTKTSIWDWTCEDMPTAKTQLSLFIPAEKHSQTPHSQVHADYYMNIKELLRCKKVTVTVTVTEKFSWHMKIKILWINVIFYPDESILWLLYPYQTYPKIWTS